MGWSSRDNKNMPQEWSPWQLLADNSFKHYEDHMPSIREWLAKEERGNEHV